MSNNPRPSDDPNAENIRRLRGWGCLLPIAKVRGENRSSYRILWRQLGFQVALTLAAIWTAAALSAWALAKHGRGIAEARFVDVLLPSRWENFHRAAGDHAIALAEQQLAADHGAQAVFHLRHGLAKSPGNLRGRLLLADIYARNARSDEARQLLLDGFQHAYRDARYLRDAFAFLLQRQEDELVQSYARTLLDDPALPAASAAVAAHAAATAAFLRGHFDRAEDVLETQQLSATHDGRLLRARMAWERGYRELALIQIRALAAEFPSSDIARAQLRQWVLVQGDHDEFRRLALLEKITHPEDSTARIDLLGALRTTAPESFAAELELFFHDFARDETALVLLANFAASTVDPALAARVHDHCVAFALPHDATALLHAETLIAAREFHRALDHIRSLLDTDRSSGQRQRALLNGLQAIAHHGLGDPAVAELYLRNFLSQPQPRAETYLAVAERLLDLGARDHARETLARAVDADPLNQPALTRLIELDLALDRPEALPRHLARLLTMRRPAPAVLRGAYARLASDESLPLTERETTLSSLAHVLAATAPVTQ